jgi:hypothetical protein
MIMVECVHVLDIILSGQLIKDSVERHSMKCSFYNNSGKDSAINIFENVTCPLQIHCSIYQTFNDQVNIIYEVCPNCDNYADTNDIH